MGIYMESYAMVGVKFTPTITHEKVVVRGCNHTETKDNFCPQCGKKMWVKETKTIHQFEDIFDDVVEPLSNKLNETFDGHGVVAFDYDSEHFFFGYGVYAESHQCRRIPLLDSEDVKRDLQEALEEYKIWDQCKDSFGFWIVSVGH